MDLAIKIIFLVVFFAVMIGIGLITRKKANSVEGFVLGGRNAGPWLTAFGYGTSYFSAVVFIGYAGQFGWKYGVASTWIGIGNAVIGSLLAWIILGRRTRVMTKHLNSKTMPDFFGKRFDSKSLRIAAALISFIFLIPYTSSVYNGLSRLFNMAFNIDYKICIIVMAALTCVYVILGGYMATVVNDLVQGIIMLFGITAVIATVLNNNGGFLTALTTLSQTESDLPVTAGMQGAFTSFFGPDPLNLFGVIILTSLGTWGLPQMVGKFYAIKDEKSVKAGTIISTIFAFIVAGGCYFLGGFARLYKDNPAIYKDDGSVMYDSIIPTMLDNLPTILVGVVPLQCPHCLPSFSHRAQQLRWTSLSRSSPRRTKTRRREKRHSSLRCVSSSFSSSQYQYSSHLTLRRSSLSLWVIHGAHSQELSSHRSSGVSTGRRQQSSPFGYASSSA